MPPVAAISHVCGIFFSVTGERAQRVRFCDAQYGRKILIPRIFFGTSDIYLARVWVMTPGSVVKKFLVYFTAIIGSLPNDHTRVKHALIFAVGSSERFYLCFRDITMAQSIIAVVGRHLTETTPDAARVVRVSLDDLA